MKIRIGFSKSTKKFAPVSWLIRAIEGTEYSHVYLRKESRYGEYIYQASGTQVNFMSIDTFLEHNDICEEYEFEVPDDIQDELITFMVKHAGKPYGTMQLFIMLGRRLGLNVKGDGSHSFVCSELQNVICTKFLGIEIPEEQDFVSPKVLHPYINKYGKRII